MSLLERITLTETDDGVYLSVRGIDNPKALVGYPHWADGCCYLEFGIPDVDGYFLTEREEVFVADSRAIDPSRRVVNLDEVRLAVERAILRRDDFRRALGSFDYPLAQEAGDHDPEMDFS